jgi:hypothetical protein
MRGRRANFRDYWKGAIAKCARRAIAFINAGEIILKSWVADE